MPVAPHGPGAAMSQLRGADWRLTLAPSWQASDDGGCISNARPDDLGALQQMLGSLRARSDHG